MKQLLVVSSLLFFSFTKHSVAQTAINGVINEYATVTSFNSTMESVAVSNAMAYSVGDEVLIIQMKGATIDQSQTSAFGSISNYNQAGKYEIMKICAVQGNTVYFTKPLLNTYNASGSVQLVTVPTYNDAIISGSDLTAKNWDGSNGGILVLRVNGLLDFGTQNINVSEKGFRGGAAVTSGNGCTFIDDLSYYSASSSADSKAQKGEGIAKPIVNKECGRGSLANGGGGGNNHNAGGSGGGNYGSGGSGGQRVKASPFTCGSVTGADSKNLVTGYMNNKLFLGGGGGSGHGNNAGIVGESGMNGGGMVIIIADSVEGNGQNIEAKGGSSVNAANEGGGGAGAGGTVVLTVNNFNSPLNIDVIGGDGASTDNVGTSNCSGPGGGGGGGIVLFSGASQPLNVTISLNGGSAGVIATTAQTNCPLGGKNGAGDGQLGTSLFNWLLLDQSVGLHNETISETDCSAFESPSGKYIWTTSGVYIDTVTKATGCQKITTINLTIDSVDTRVNTLVTSLEAVAFPALYQWLDCNKNFAPISGATSRLFKAQYDGKYAVKVTSGECSDTSLCYEVVGVGINDKSSFKNVKIYPNPTTGIVQFNFNVIYNDLKFELINTHGQILDKGMIETKSFSYEIDGPKGIYFFKISNSKSQVSLKLVKQ